MRILITGGRDFDDREMLYRALDRLHEEHGFTLVIHGAARGADRLGGEWAQERGIEVLACPADWRRYGRGAGRSETVKCSTKTLTCLLHSLVVMARTT